ncbi:outer membrane lipoprotein SlyB [Azomonas agilis]|uniref:Outer membrane lipoprotein SlyB n=1 Tax=Azomonas agilis TaxID=116849 RepID=A0A562J1S6_9GAMM|nr:hypothetical protein [Azomonas agilis]TWH77136.1 outer membrane lipoprotein SlyB [Azomonas agilis]
MRVKKFVAIALSLFIESGVTQAADRSVTIPETRVVATRGGTIGEVKAAINDAAVGKGFGGLSGVMAGAASGGPIGAVVGAVAGMFAGGTAEHAVADPAHTVNDTGRNARRAYIILKEDGEEIRVRSPNRVFQVGDKVEIVKGRLYAIEG